jgi:heterodisulfide reductase subunit C
MVQQILFLICLGLAVYFFVKRITFLRRVIFMGLPEKINDQKPMRWKTMFKVAMGQSKMGARPLAAFFHLIIYIGFVLINIEVIEILIDGILGTHRIFREPLGDLYIVSIQFFEILAVGVILSCIIFLLRRYVFRVPRLVSKDLDGWPKRDASNILVIEVILMFALLGLNAVDSLIPDHHLAPFWISSFLTPLFSDLSVPTLMVLERVFWWVHILGILAFLNYVPYSKHFHIILAFPNTWYSKLSARGSMDNLNSIKKEVDSMMNPEAPVSNPDEMELSIPKFGANDVDQLSWKSILDAYSCTECGRCTDECPANQTGKLLSPRRIMMATRDRAESLGKLKQHNGKDFKDDNILLGNYITEEELWACTSCNACTQACPVNIDPLKIIMDLRRDLVLEQSKAPGSLNTMFTNIENNGAPWQFSQADRGNWTQE